MFGRRNRVALGIVVLLAVCSSYCGGGDSGDGTPTPTPTATPPPDTAAPTLLSVEVVDYTHIRITFSDEMDEATVETAGNYVLTPDRAPGISVGSAARDDSNLAEVLLTTTQSLLPLEYTLTVNDVEDTSGNPIAADSVETFTGNGKVAFVTQSAGSGDLSTWAKSGSQNGVAGADAVCQQEAEDALLAGTFKAWISTDTSAAGDRIGAGSGPWIRADGFPVAEDLTEFAAGRFWVPIRVDAEGNPVSGSTNVWTNTDVDGSVFGGGGNYDCLDWTSSLGGGGVDQQAGFGNLAGVGYAWTRLGNASCGSLYHLFCFQTGAGPDMPAVAEATGKIVFATSTSYDGDLGSYPDAGGASGALAGDAICQARATAAGLSGTFRAWLSDSSTDAIARFVGTDGARVLLNGVKIADSLADVVADGTLLTSIYLTETESYVESTPNAWTGTATDGTVADAAKTCNDWAEDGGTFYGTAGQALRGDENWTNYYEPACSSVMRLFCFED